MKNANLFFKLSGLIPVLLTACIINLSAQNELIGYTHVFTIDGGHSYYLSNCEATWEEANEAATEMGGYLATLTTGFEIENLSYYILPAFRHLYVGGELTGLWMGLRGEDGIYEWVNGESGTLYWISEPEYADGAGLIIPDWEPYSNWAAYPVSGETEYIVEFDSPPYCNDNPNKAYVCHNGNTICVNASALQSHLNHGDLEGACGPCNTYAMQSLPDDGTEVAGHSLHPVQTMQLETMEAEAVQHFAPSDQLQIFPNPTSAQLHVVLPGTHHEGTLKIFSLSGQEIKSLPLTGQRLLELDLSSYASGLYLVDVRSAKGHYQKKIVKLY